MEQSMKCSSCRGVSFETKNDRRLSFNRGSFNRIFPSDRWAIFQRSESRPSSHFCNLDDDEEEANDVEQQEELWNSSDLPVPKKDTLPQKPSKPESRLSVILLDQGLFTVYKRLFILCLALNLSTILFATSGVFPYAMKEAGFFSVGNLLVLVLCRSEAFLRCVFWVAVKVLGRSWVPIPLKTATTSFLQCVGGIHSGCGVSSIMWLIYYLVESLRRPETSSAMIKGVAFGILGLLVISSAAAFPLVRHLHHNIFEGFHRFAGWAAVILLWIFLILTVSYNPDDRIYRVSISALAKKKDVWFTWFITFLIVLPWLTVRKVAVEVSTSSAHASLIRFAGGVNAGLLGRISRSPLSDWHAFGIISDGKCQHMMLAGAVGDFTRELVSDPPKFLYTRCIHFAGLPYLINMYDRVVLVATGSGICVFLSFSLQPCAAQVYVIWVAKSIEKNFGEEIVRMVKDHPPEKRIIHDTAVSGRPNVAEMTVKAVRNWNAEVVIVTSNPSGSRDVVNECKTRGIPAFGPIWDS
ncbi:hypothetical protein SUGI_0787570 [Cryptomeria japonica]|uniref:adenylate-forming reductase 03009 n=1 Tax=Cryptomeria japonica TaxID=3369 RepID=UPI002414C162|nr:adenylate-forming reductase 03009 [Cryptomeria japonica]GLJ38625.1 hypothetical protein SUGI_0787570 [Cryptomeria japonica]